MPDPRLTAIAADAASRGWDVDWHENQHRIELLVIPTVSDPHDGMFGMGFGVALGGNQISVWVWECWAGCLIEPFIGFEDVPPDEEMDHFQAVTCLNDALPLFDKAAEEFLAWQRNPRLNPCWDKSALEEWASIQPLAGGFNG